MENNLVIDLPMHVQFILEMLRRCGFEAYIVGGCVRDSIMNKTPHDWDICTSALPEQIIEVFDRYPIIPTGIKHGTVTLVLFDVGGVDHFYEITTYRIDGEYKDSRHPENVEFVSDLKQDLSRRDFTINAMAYNPTEGLIDYFGGMKDITNKMIRCVGSPEQRFNEDALRIMRALRFAMTLGFNIETNTRFAMDFLIDNLKSISVERINSEISKILTNIYVKNNDVAFYQLQQRYYLRMLRYLYAINNNITEKGYTEKFRKIWEYGNDNLRFNLTVTFDSPQIEEILKWLKYSNVEIDYVNEVCSLGHDLLDNNEWQNNPLYYSAKKLLNQIKHSDYKIIIEFAKSFCDDFVEPNPRNKWLFLSDLETQICQCLQYNDAYLVKHLAIDGNDLKELGYKGREIGVILNGLLDLVMRDETKNNHDDLIIAIPQVIVDE